MYLWFENIFLVYLNGWGMAPAPAPVQEYDKRTSRELSEAVPQTDILGNIIWAFLLETGGGVSRDNIILERI